MPTIIDIFNQKPFRAIELTTFMKKIDVVPTLLGDFGEALFPVTRSRTRAVAIYQNRGIWRLVPTSAIGAPPVELEKNAGEMRYFSTKRLAKGSTVMAESLQGVLAEPLFDATISMQGEIADRAGKIRDDIELTHEHMRLGAVQGKVLDADGVTVIDDWYANWNVVKPAAWNMHFDVATTQIRLICDNILNAMWYASQGSWVEGQTVVHALCGFEFFQSLITHPMVERLYLNYAAAQELSGKVGDSFPFGGIVWHRYRGNITGEFSIAPNEAKLFPVGGSDVFQRVMGPAEFDPFINQPGQDFYALTINDKDRGAWVRTEGYNYPLFICLRPEMLQSCISH